MPTPSLPDATPLMANRKSNELTKLSKSSLVANRIIEELKREGKFQKVDPRERKSVKIRGFEDKISLIKADAFSPTGIIQSREFEKDTIITIEKPSKPMIQLSSSSVSKTNRLKPECGKNSNSKIDLKPSDRLSNKVGRRLISTSVSKHSRVNNSHSNNSTLENNIPNVIMASVVSFPSSSSSSGTAKPPMKATPPTAATPTRPIVINQASSINKSGPIHNELAFAPALSPQLILSSIITTQANLSNEPGASLNRQTVTTPIKQSIVTATTAKTKNTNTSSDIVTPIPTSALTTTTTSSSSSSASTTTTLSSTTSNTPISSVKSPENNCQTPSKAILVANTTNKSSSDRNQTTSPIGQAANARLMDMGKRLLDAAREGRIEHVRQLVFDSSAPFTSDWLGTTALHLAAQNGHAGIAEILLRGGVNRDAKTKLERTALHLAAQGGFLEVVDLLLNHGCDVDARDMLKMTPLHWAVERGHTCVAERLLYSGADFNAKSKFYLTPIDIATNSKSYKMIEIFKSWTIKHDILDPHSSNLNSLVFNDPSSMLGVDYHLAFNADRATTSQAAMLDIDEPCIDLVELEWSTLKLEPDFFLTNDEDEPKVEYLMKIVDELQKENRQLRKKVEQLSTTCQ